MSTSITTVPDGDLLLLIQGFLRSRWRSERCGTPMNCSAVGQSVPCRPWENAGVTIMESIGKENAQAFPIYNFSTVAMPETANSPPSTDVREVVLQVLHVYYMPSLMALGAAGNVAVSAILLGSSLRRNSANHYLAAAGVSDAFFLLGLLLLWLENLGLDLYNRKGWCQLISFVNSVCTFLSLWLIVAFAIDRLIVHVLPKRSAKLCTPFRAKIVILSIVVIAVVVYVNISLTVGVVKYGGLSRCMPLPQFMSHLRWLGLIDGMINLTLPYIVLMVILAIILRYACAISGDVDDPHTHSYVESTPQDNLLHSRPARLSVMTVLLLATFLVMRLPSEVFRFLHSIRGVTNKFYPISQTEYYWQQFSQKIFETSFALKLFLLLAFHPMFRQTVSRRIRMVCDKIFFKGRRSKTEGGQTVDGQGNNNGDDIQPV